MSDISRRGFFGWLGAMAGGSVVKGEEKKEESPPVKLPPPPANLLAGTYMSGAGLVVWPGPGGSYRSGACLSDGGW